MRFLPILTLPLVLLACSTDSDVIEVTADCEAWLACAAVTDPENITLYEGTYGQDSACWVGDAEALACTEACQVSVETAHMADPSLVECWPDGSPDMMYVFLGSEIWSWNPVGSCDPLDYRNTVTTFSAETSGSTFDMAFESDINANAYEMETICTETGWNFTCETMTSYGEEFQASGTFDGFSSGTIDIVYQYDSQEFPCSFEGEPR